MGWLWLLNEDGIPYRVPDISKPENGSDIAWSAEPARIDDEELQIRQIASCSKSVFALDSNGSAHVFLHPAVLLVRRSFEVYENQRWYPVIGWKFPLPTDWPRISTEKGERASFDNEALPSGGWRWEESREIQKGSDCDKEGWQYSQVFSRSARWSKSMGISSFVRRRRWKRSMRYVAVAKWNPLPDSGKCFVSIAAGCSSTTNQGCLLFAIGMDGCVYKRTISTDLPEGDQWDYVEGITNPGGDKEDVVLLSCAPQNPFLLAVTWEGKMYGRTGITASEHKGTSWQPLQTPGGKPVTAVSIGNEALWATTADNQLYYHHIDVPSALKSRNFLYFHEQSYRHIGQGWSSPAVSSTDHVFLIKNGKIINRDGISLEEKTGKAFVPVVDRSGEEKKWISVATGGFHQDKLPAHWINDNFFFNNNTDFSYQQTRWRKQILDTLISQNEHCWDIFQNHSADASLAAPEGDEDLSKHSKVRIQFPPNKNYFEGSISLFSQKLTASTGRKRLEKTFDKLLQSEKCCDMCPFKYCLSLMFSQNGGENCNLRIAFPSEKERDSWHEQLQLIIIKEYVQSPRDSVPSACWTIGYDGNVRFHPMNELILDEKQNPTRRPFSSLRSIDIPGHFQSITAGADEIVWSLTELGLPHTLSPGWKPTEERNPLLFEQVDTVTKTIYEYQRRQFFRGWAPLSSEVQGIAPYMGENSPVTSSYSKLPSHEWSWLEEKWEVEGAEEDEGWSYASEIKGTYKSDNTHGPFRRRKLTRRAKFTAMTPWISIEGPALKDVVVQKDLADRILVFGLTVNGEVLLRQGVERTRPQGYVWKQIITDSPVSCLALRTPTELWAVTTVGKLWKRKCEDQTDMECCDWVEEPCKVQGTVSSMIVQTRCWLIVNDSLVMLDVQKGAEEDGFTLLSSGPTSGSYESHQLCSLVTPSALCLMPCGFLAVLEGGEVNHHPAWQKKIMKAGRRTVKTYECQRVTLSTGYAKSCTFN